MIYSNKTYQVEEVEMPFGVLRAVALGEPGRGRRQILLPVPNGMKELRAGLNPRLEIGKTRNGNPCIVRCRYDTPYNIYMVLSSQAQYTRRGNGSVWFYRKGYEADFADMEADKEGAKSLGELFEEKKHYIAKAWGADGEAGRIGKWTCYVLEAEPGSKYMVRWGGYGYGLADTLYFVNGACDVDEVDENQLGFYFDLMDVEAPKRTKDGELEDFCYFV